MRSIIHASLCALLVIAAGCKPKAPTISEANVAGFWEGTLKAGLIDLRLLFTIKKGDDGKLSATMASVDQGVNDIPVDSVTVADGTVSMAAAQMLAKYRGTLSADGGTITGEWEQAGKKFPLELKRVEKLPTLNRPQEPKRPYPYDEEEVIVENAKAGLKLAGTLTKPKGHGPFPAAVLISGSGPQDRDESLMGHKPFLVIADHLTRNGIAVLRFDDRGVGKSTGTYATATTLDFASDATACVDFLKARKDIDSKRIGLMGHSEGAMAGLVVASARDDIAFLVMIAGPGTSGEEVMLAQAQVILRGMKVSDEQLQWQRESQLRLFALLREGASTEKLKAAFLERIESIPGENRAQVEASIRGGLDQQIQLLTSPWLRGFLDFDTVAYLKKTRCPILALNGGKDVQVLPKENLEGIVKAAKASGNRDVTVKEFPELNHLFQTAKTGMPAEYGTIEETFSPAVLKLMGEWLRKRMGLDQ